MERVYFQRKQIDVKDALVSTGLAKSKGEANRLIKQGAVEIEGERYGDFVFVGLVKEATGKGSIDLRVGYREKEFVFEG